MSVSRLTSIVAICDFRLFWASTSIRVIGEVGEFIAQAWMVLLLTDDSALWIGIASGIRGAGHIGLGLIGADFADRFDRRTVLGIFSIARGLTLAVLSLLVLQDKVQLWQVLTVVFIQGGADGIIAPSANGLIYNTVGPRRLMNAIAYVLAADRISWATGSVLFGNVISAAGVGVAYSIASVALLASAVPLYFMNVSRSAQPKQASIWLSLRQGIIYVGSNGPLRALLILSILTECFGFSYITMLPVIAKNVLNVGPTGLGYLSAAGGIGSLMGTFVVALLSEFKNKWKLLTIGTLSAGTAIFLFATSSWYLVSLALAGVIGLSLVTYDVSINTLLQLLSDDMMRGRVLGLYGMTWGFTPAGGLALGTIASIASAPFAIGLGGIVILTYTAFVIARMGTRLQLPMNHEQ